MTMTSFFQFNIVFIAIFSIFMSCTEDKVSSKGHFTMNFDTPSRSIASMGHISKQSLKKLSERYSPTQLYLHCKMREKNSHKQCYYKKLQQTLTNMDLDKNDPEYKEIENFFSIEKIEHNLEQGIKKAQRSINTRMLHVITKRSHFCKMNSKHYLKRCLMQYTNQDSIALVNQLQSSFPRINGIEYLYLKQKVEKELTVKLNEEYQILSKTL